MRQSAIFYILFLSSAIWWNGNAFSQDKTPPEKPELIYVSLDTSALNADNINILWKKSPSPDVAKYILYYEVKTINGYEGVKFDSVPASVTSYIHNTSSLNLTPPIRYSISATDSAGNESPRKPGVHAGIFNTVSYDSCNSTLTLRWTKYLGWGNNVSGYRVNASINSGAYQTIAGLNSNDSSYVIFEVPENTQYDFIIEGVKNDSLVSFSNVLRKNTYMPLPPSDLRLDYVTVTGSQTVELKFGYTDTTPIDKYALLRSSEELAKFEPVKIISNVNSSPVTVNDSIFTSVSSYFYRIGAVNTCGEIIGTSNLGTSILLVGNNDKESNVLEWNSYRDFPLGTGSYEVYRIDTAGSSILIGNVTSPQNFTDDLPSLYGQDFTGKIIYQVKAVENGGNNFSFSNFLEINVKTEIWVPNAFTPNGDGRNDVFAPRLNFIPREYLLIIFDRSGLEVFSSKNADIGWDGRVNGNNFAPEGVYIYHVQYSSFNGIKANKTGNVTVFYPRQ